MSSYNNEISTLNEWLEFASEKLNDGIDDQVENQKDIMEEDQFDDVDEIQLMLHELIFSNEAESENVTDEGKDWTESAFVSDTCDVHNDEEVVKIMRTDNNTDANKNDNDNIIEKNLINNVDANREDDNLLSCFRYDVKFESCHELDEKKKVRGEQNFVANTCPNDNHVQELAEISLSPVVASGTAMSAHTSSLLSSTASSPSSLPKTSHSLTQSLPFQPSSSSPPLSSPFTVTARSAACLPHDQVINNNHIDEQHKRFIQSKHWICVTNLEHQDNEEQLKHMFYPHGADEAFITRSNNGMLFGYVGFKAKEMALLAVAKMHQFIPCYHTQALHVCAVTLDEALKMYLQRNACAEAEKIHNTSDHFTSSQGNTPSNSTRMNITPLSSNVKNYNDNSINMGNTPFTIWPQVLFKQTSESKPKREESVSCAESVDAVIQESVAKVVIKVENATSTQSVEEIKSSLEFVAWQTTAPQKFCEELLKQLLCILIAAGTVENITRVMTINCANVIAHLFITKLIPGDPFQLVSRMLQRGVFAVLQVEGICTLAHLCGTLQYTISKASFWALVSQTATKTSSELIRNCLIRHLRQSTNIVTTHSAQRNYDRLPATVMLPHTEPAEAANATTNSSSQLRPFSTAVLPRVEHRSTTFEENISNKLSRHFNSTLFKTQNVSTSEQLDRSMPYETTIRTGNALSLGQSCSLLENYNRPHIDDTMLRMSTSNVLQQHEEVKRRTVYISHLPFCLPQKALRDLLMCAGVVNKIRVCVGKGYQTLFAFVEMQTQQGAKACMRFNGINLFGYNVRVQAARNPIQDVAADDAVYNSSGLVVQQCLFGVSDSPLIDCVTTLS